MVGSDWNKKRIVTVGAVVFPRNLEMTRRKELVTDCQGEKDYTDICIWKACWGAQLGALVAGSLQTPKESSPLFSSSDCCQHEENLAGRCPSSNGPAFTRPSSVTRSPVCLLSGRSQICPSLALICSTSVSTARKEERSFWEGRNSHPGAVFPEC